MLEAGRSDVSDDFEKLYNSFIKFTIVKQITVVYFIIIVTLNYCLFSQLIGRIKINHVYDETLM